MIQIAVVCNKLKSLKTLVTSRKIYTRLGSIEF